MKLDPAEVTLVCILFKMQHEGNVPVLADWELDVFILQFYILQSMSLQDLKSQKQILPTPRSAHLATLFAR